MILLDTSGLLSYLDVRSREHADCVSALESSIGPYLLSPFVLAELDHMVSDRLGADAAMELLGEVAGGVYRLEPLDAADITAAHDVLTRFRDLRAGLADASVVVLSRRYGVDDVLTLDQRHFRVLSPAPGRSFRILPADA